MPPSSRFSDAHMLMLVLCLSCRPAIGLMNARARLHTWRGLQHPSSW
jgi:hypothetical protein